MINDLKPHYRTGRDDLRKDFFTRCLTDCDTYARAAGYVLKHRTPRLGGRAPYPAAPG